MTVLAAVAGCTLICGLTIITCMNMVTKERQQIYVLDGDITFLAERAQLEANFTMEARAHIQLFHQYFFNLPPDNDYIKWTVGKAMYMADGTALKQKQALDENGFFLTSYHLQLSAPSSATQSTLMSMSASSHTTALSLSREGHET